MKYIVANLKSSMDNEAEITYIKYISKKLIRVDNIIIAPSFIYLKDFIETDFKIAAQNVFEEEGDSHTGIITVNQLKNIGVKYIIIGYSDVRTNFKEDNEQLIKKVKLALRYNMKVIFCVGETSEQRVMKKEYLTVKAQLKELLKMDSQYMSDIIIAYEPVWAIGKGVTPKNNEIEEMVAYIKRLLPSQNIPVLYGGSVNRNNINRLKELEILDGFMVGKASYNPDSFISLVDAIYSEK